MMSMKATFYTVTSRKQHKEYNKIILWNLATQDVVFLCLHSDFVCHSNFDFQYHQCLQDIFLAVFHEAERSDVNR